MIFTFKGNPKRYDSLIFLSPAFVHSSFFFSKSFADPELL